jgi:hypothetical protein
MAMVVTAELMERESVAPVVERMTIFALDFDLVDIGGHPQRLLSSSLL